MTMKKEQKTLIEIIGEESHNTWQQNQDKARERKAVKKRVKAKMEKTREGVLAGMRQEDQSIVKEEIEEFEKRLKKMDEEPVVVGSMRTDKAGGGAGVSSMATDKRGMERDVRKQMRAIGNKKKEAANKSLNREKRRRRFIKEREEAQMEGYHNLGVDMVRRELTRKCVDEMRINEKLEIIGKHKTMLSDNRDYRQEMYKTRSAIDSEEALRRDSLYFDAAKVTCGVETESQQKKMGKALNARQNATKNQNEIIASETLAEIVNLSMAVAGYREYSQHKNDRFAGDPIPEESWSDLKMLFLGRKPLLSLERPTTDERIWGEITSLPLLSEEGNEGGSDAMAETASALDCFVSENYIKIGNELSIMANAPDTVKFALGDKIISTSLAAEPFADPPTPPLIPHFPLRIAIAGRTFAGKSEQAARLAERYNLKVIGVDSELQTAIEEYMKVHSGVSNEPTEGSLQHDIVELGRTAQSALLQGGEVSDETYASLTVVAIKKLKRENEGIKLENERRIAENKELNGEDAKDEDVEVDEEFMGWVLDDFPQTKNQAIILEKCLSGYDHNAHVDIPADRKCDLSLNSPPALPSTDLIVSGLDLFIYLENDYSSTLKRSLGRRVDPQTEQRYHLETNRPPYDLICKKRLVEPHDQKNPTANLSYQVLAHTHSCVEMKEFVDKMFGTLRIVNTTNATPDGAFALVNGHVNEQLMITAEKQKERVMARRKKEEEEAARQEEVVRKEEEDKKRLEEEEAAKFDENGEELFCPAVVDDWVAPTLEEASLSSDLAKLLMRRWDESVVHYKSVVGKVIRSLREERIVATTRLHDVRRIFRELLFESPDDMQKCVDDFVGKFNEVETDMRFDDNLKCELHLRCSELGAVLWDKIEKRKDDLCAYSRELRNDGWRDVRSESIKNNYALLIQSEVDRFSSGVELLSDICKSNLTAGSFGGEGKLDKVLGFGEEEEVREGVGGGKGGGKKDKKKGKGTEEDEGDEWARGVRSKLPPFFCEFKAAAAAADEEVAEATIEKGKGKKGKKAEDDEAEVDKDRLEIVFDSAIKYSKGWSSDVFKMTGGEGGEGAVWEKDEFDEASKIYGEAIGDEAKARDVALVKEYYAVVNYEETLLRARIEALFTKANEVCREVSSLVEKCFDQVDADVDERIKGQQSVIECFLQAVETTIENEESIEYDLNVDSFKFVINYQKRLVERAPDKIEPSVETYDSVKFNQRQYACVQSRLSSLAGLREAISRTDFVDCMMKLGNVDCALPEQWSCKTHDDYYGMFEGQVELSLQEALAKFENL